MYSKIKDQIIFYYTFADLFEDVQHLSAYMCKNAVSKDGADLSERYAITDDEEGMFRICLREALPLVQEKMMALTHGLENAFESSLPALAIRTVAGGDAVPANTYREVKDYDATTPILAITPDKSVVEIVPCAGEIASTDYTYYYNNGSADFVVIHTVDHKAYNPNDPSLADAALQTAIEQGAISEFYTRVTEQGLTKLSQELFTSSLISLEKNLFRLKRKSVL